MVLVGWGGDGRRATAIIVHGSLEMTRRQDQCLCGMCGVWSVGLGAHGKQGDEVGEISEGGGRLNRRDRDDPLPAHPDAAPRKMCLVDGGDEEEEDGCVSLCGVCAEAKGEQEGKRTDDLPSPPNECC